MSGIYIHIPFCKQACSYCDFYFVTKSKEEQRLEFVDQLIANIRSYKNSAFAEEPVETIYFGGGTPSLIKAASIDKILNEIRKSFKTELKEVTVELNPDDVTAEYLSELKKAGINRVSMGIQTFDQDLLKFMNRAHTAQESHACLRLLKESEINVFTADLIYGNPGQSLSILEKDIKRLLEFDPPHVSAYSLTIEQGTRLGKQLDLGRIAEPEDEEVSRHFDLVESMLTEAGIFRYEVSNFAKPGSEAVHNSNYWTHQNYLGLGPGAHSFWWDRQNEFAERWENAKDLKAYLSQPSQTSEKEKLKLNDLAEERIMLSLRTKKGITLTELKQAYNYTLSPKQIAYLNRKSEEGLVRFDDRITLNSEGLKLADALTLDLISLG